MGGTFTSFSERLFGILREMDSSIRELETVAAGSESSRESYDSQLPQLNKKRSTAQMRSKKEKDDRDHHTKGEHGIFGIFHRKSTLLSTCMW